MTGSHRHTDNIIQENILPHFEYCCPLLLGISKTLNSKIERANQYALRTLLKLGNTVDYEYCLKLASMESLKRRRIEHALTLFFKCYILRGPSNISNFFTPRDNLYNLRASKLNVKQPSYNNLYMHNSFHYIISHFWNHLPSAAKASTTMSQFRSYSKKAKLSGCRCTKCT